MKDVCADSAGGCRVKAPQGILPARIMKNLCESGREVSGALFEGER